MIDGEILAKHNIYLDNDLLHINQKGKKAYIKIKHITAVEFDCNKMILLIILGLILLIIGLYIPIKTYQMIVIFIAILSIISSYFCVYVNIYPIGYKPIMINGAYHSMNELFEELKKLVVEK